MGLTEIINVALNSTTSTSKDAELVNVLRLIRSENVGVRTFYNLLKIYGSAAVVLNHVGEMSIRGGRNRPIKVMSLSEAEDEIDRTYAAGAAMISFLDTNYSFLLRRIYDAPPIITYKGDISLMNRISIAFVGSRNASAHARQFTNDVVRQISDIQVDCGEYKSHVAIASGLARGIDTAAHVASVQNGTIAVIAGGIGHIYPPENEKLYAKIAENGLILSELPIGTAPLAQHFPQRNRIISGVSYATAVVEATMNSGSLITAKFATEHNRDVFAVPGFPIDPRSKGTNKLIRDGAGMLESADDIINNIQRYVQDWHENMNLAKNIEGSVVHDESRTYKEFRDYSNEVSNDMRIQVLELLSYYPIEVETLAEKAHLSLPNLYLILLELELAGRVIRSNDNKVMLK